MRGSGIAHSSVLKAIGCAHPSTDAPTLAQAGQPSSMAASMAAGRGGAAAGGAAGVCGNDATVLNVDCRALEPGALGCAL